MKKLGPLAYFAISKMVEDGKIDVRSIEEACKDQPWAKTHTVINRHRQELKKEGIISNTIQIDYEKLHYGTACLLIKTTDKKALDQLSQYLQDIIHVYQLYICEGAFNLVAILHIEELVVYSAFIESIRHIEGVEKVESLLALSSFDLTAERFKQMAESASKE